MERPEAATALQHGSAFRLRPARSTYLLFGVVFGALIVFLAVAALRSPTFWIAVGFAALGMAAFFVYFSRMELVVSSVDVTYTTLFRRRSIALSQIVESHIQWNLGRDTRPLLIINSGVGDRPMAVNLKPFEARDIAKLLQLHVLRVHKSDDVA